MKTFTWERGPFFNCHNCSEKTFGLLRAGGQSLTMRCSKCRFTYDEDLPPLNKKVIYLDQFVFSLLFNVESGGPLHRGHEGFAKELHDRLRRLVSLQQIILPHSDIHRDETILFHSPVDLRAAYEFMGGDAQFVDTDEVELNQTMDAAEAFLTNKSLNLNLLVDQVLEERRNEWLPDMHISVRADYSSFAENLRRRRDQTHSGMEKLAAKWAKERPSFKDVLQNEFNLIMSAKVGALPTSAPVQHEAHALSRLFAERGVPVDQVGQAVRDFWSSKICRDLPHHRISSYLFAAVARRVVQGQKTVINRGLMNDIRAIACYAPYVDAMFVDKTSEQLMHERPLIDDLKYKALIFSFSNRDAFLAYLDEIEAATPPDVKEFASRIYGI
ncbi:hypothetical protein GUK34_04630 [Rhizobium leguminosarum]|uniref:hypothetical protein n=1 Tax=Rhizobium ruizarguesonis TaxID=2081791 RepID=UPI0013B67C31|nr:hypothetical protein [Rhizobium ruizarguesonis]NEI04168.1 hypothetical protein [Rhizobium ruizarguesonis]